MGGPKPAALTRPGGGSSAASSSIVRLVASQALTFENGESQASHPVTYAWDPSVHGNALGCQRVQRSIGIFGKAKRTIFFLQA